MIYNQAIKDCFQQHYVFIPSRNYDAQCGIIPVNFWDLEYTRTFVGNLHASEDYWRAALTQLGLISGPDISELELTISQVLLNKQLLALPVIPFPEGTPEGVARTLVVEK